MMRRRSFLAAAAAAAVVPIVAPLADTFVPAAAPRPAGFLFIAPSGRVHAMFDASGAHFESARITDLRTAGLRIPIYR